MSQPQPRFDPFVLIVTSDPGPLRYWSEMFAGRGYRVTASADGRDALEKIRTGDFDLVVASLRIDGLDSLELLRLVPETAPGLPVIVIGDRTSKFNDTYIQCAELLGAAQTHSHAPDPELLIEGARVVVSQYRATRGEQL